GEPQADSGPEKVVSREVGEIGCHQSHERGHGEMNQHGMDRVPTQGHPTNDRFMIHKISFHDDNAVWKSRRWLVLITVCLLVSGCSGPFSTLDPAGPSARAVAWLWWAMFSFST